MLSFRSDFRRQVSRLVILSNPNRGTLDNPIAGIRLQETHNRVCPGTAHIPAGGGWS